MDIEKLLKVLSGEISQESAENSYSGMPPEERESLKKAADEAFQAIMDTIETSNLEWIVELLLTRKELGFAELSVSSPSFRRISVDCVLRCFVNELIRRAEENEKKPS